MLIHDGQDIWLACRRLNQGPAEENGSLVLTQTQFDALRFSVKMGLPEAYDYTNGRHAMQSIQREPAILTVNAIGIIAKID